MKVETLKTSLRSYFYLLEPFSRFFAPLGRITLSTSLNAKGKVNSLVDVIRDVVTSDNLAHPLAHLTETLTQQFALAPSEKHMVGRDLDRMEPTPSFQNNAAA